ncbi:MAG: RNA polymerase sigma factor, partial [Thermoleophilaceae bacterium]
MEAVRDGDDPAFEELYRRYNDRIAAYVRRMVRDPARAEDLVQDAFFCAVRRIRATDAEIAFKPWIFEIARNATIDHWRRSSRAEEVSVEADEQLRPSDRRRLVGSAGPDSALVDKERLEHLRGALDELSTVHTRIIVMRELEGLSYREIAQRLDLSRASVESALFRARRRLESEYADISEGRRCVAMRTVMARLAEGLRDRRDEGRLARHARRCHVCRRRARELGVEPLAPLTGLRRRVAA